MLSPADADLCARDPGLPGLAAVLDAAALAEQAGLPGLRQTYLRYKPGTSAVAGLTPADGSLRAFAAMTYSRQRYAEVRARPEWQTAEEPVLFLDDVCTALVPMSRDRRIKAARRLCDPERRPRYLAGLGVRGRLWLLHYKPGRRLVARIEDAGGPTAVLKSHAGEGFRNALAGARHAHRLSRLTLLGADERRRSITLPWIPGRPLSAATYGDEEFRATGAELARLHAAAPPAARPSGDAYARGLLAEAEAVAVLLPHSASTARSLAAALVEVVSAEPHVVAALHGDFSADQVVVSPAGPVVIDWDRAAAGDARRDLGSFLARLDADVLGGALASDAAEAAGAALLDGYAERTGAAPTHLGGWRAAALFALATEAFRARRPDWPARVEAVLARSEALIRDVPERSSRRQTGGLVEALDVGLMRTRLATALGRSPESMCSLTVQCHRHKPGRRALIRYALEDGASAPMLGKWRAKGPDHRTPAVHAALRAAGLDGRPPGRVGVPETLGTVDDPPLWLQSEVPGRDLSTCLLSGDGTDPARRAGRALALLHAADVPAERVWTLAEELRVLDQALAAAASMLPGLEARIEALSARARAAAAGLGRSHVIGIHRDFYPDQVLVDADTVWIVDLDLYARGDPVIDVGNFLAHLSELGLRFRDDPNHLAAEGAAFLAGYERERGRIDRQRLSTLHWIALARHVRISRHHPDRRNTTRRLMTLCESGFRGQASVLARSGPAEASEDARPPPRRRSHEEEQTERPHLPSPGAEGQ